jgi:hypothetical protein
LETAAEIAGGYTTMMALPLSEADAATLIGALVLTLACATVLLIRLRPEAPARERALGIAVFAVLWLRYGLTRSDVSHVYASLLPCYFLFLVVLPGMLASWSPRVAALVALFWIPVMIIDPYTSAGRRELAGKAPPTATASRSSSVPRIAPSLPTLLARAQKASGCQWARASLSTTNHTVNHALALLDRAGARGTPLYCWPNESIVNMLTGSPNVNPLLQTYLAHTPGLEQRVIAALSAEPDASVLLFRKPTVIDQVTNVSRTPLIFRYLLDHYELPAEPATDVVLLRRSAQPRGYDAKHEKCCVRRLPRKLAWNAVIPFESEDIGQNDILSLKVAVTTSGPTGLLKPCVLDLLLQFEDGSGQVERFVPVAPDGLEHELLVSAADVDADEFLAHFRQSPPRRGKRIATFILRWLKLDMLSPEPKTLELRQVSVIRPPGWITSDRDMKATLVDMSRH